MARQRKFSPASMAVIKLPKANQLVASEGRAKLMERVRKLTDEGEELVAALLLIVRNTEDDDLRMKAIDRLELMGWGKPLQVTVQADISPAQASSGLDALTTEQLEAAATGEVDAELVDTAPVGERSEEPTGETAGEDQSDHKNSLI